MAAGHRAAAEEAGGMTTPRVHLGFHSCGEPGACGQPGPVSFVIDEVTCDDCLDQQGPPQPILDELAIETYRNCCSEKGGADPRTPALIARRDAQWAEMARGHLQRCAAEAVTPGTGYKLALMHLQLAGTGHRRRLVAVVEELRLLWEVRWEEEQARLREKYIAEASDVAARVTAYLESLDGPSLLAGAYEGGDAAEYADDAAAAPAFAEVSPWLGTLIRAGYRVWIRTLPDGRILTLAIGISDGPPFAFGGGDTLAEAEERLATWLKYPDAIQLEGRDEWNARARAASKQALDLRRSPP